MSYQSNQIIVLQGWDESELGQNVKNFMIQWLPWVMKQNSKNLNTCVHSACTKLIPIYVGIMLYYNVYGCTHYKYGYLYKYLPE